MHGGRPPDEFELALHDDRRVAVRLIGPSLQGWVCATMQRDACFRLLPVGGGFGGAHECEDAPVERRQRFREWIAGSPAAPDWVVNPAARHLAPIAEEGQCQLGRDDRRSWYYVRYNIGHTQSLAEILIGDDPHLRLDAVLLVLYNMQAWWQVLQHGFLPLPADIVFDAEKRPFLLPAPTWYLPDIGSIFAEPSRALYLAPEYLQGTAPQDDSGALRRFALGAICVQAFGRMQGLADAQTDLIYAATGAIWEGIGSSLPWWLQRLQITAEAERSTRRLISSDPAERIAVDLHVLAQALESCRRRMEPQQVVREFIDTGRSAVVYQALHDILLVDGSPTMLLLAAEAAQSTGQLLEAVDFLEQAIACAVGDTEAVRRQFEMMTSDTYQGRIDELLQRQPDLGQRIDERMWRNFCVLEAEDSSSYWETDFVDYMLWRGHDATQFIYRRLFDSQGTFLWWKFPLRFQYVRALVQTGRRRCDDKRPEEGRLFMAAARTELESIKAHLYAAHWDSRLTPEQRESYFNKAKKLEEFLQLCDQTGYVS